MDDPDIPSEAVGSWPSIDLGRLGLPPLGWLFVAGAVLVAGQDLRSILAIPAEAIPPAIPSVLTRVAIALLPAALLFRAPRAHRTHRLLLAGLAALAIAELVRAAIASSPTGPSGEPWRGTALDAAWPWLGPAGNLLVGLGLIRLRARRPPRFGLLAVIALAYLALGVVPIWIVVAASPPVAPIDGDSALLLVTVPLTAAVAVWVPISAWLEREPPRAFWGLLALALPLGLAGRALDLAQAVTTTTFQPSAPLVAGVTLSAFVSAVVSLAALAALAAYARLTPVTTDAS